MDKDLKKQLNKRLKETGDPRFEGKDIWQDFPFYAGQKYLKGKYLEELKKK